MVDTNGFLIRAVVHAAHIQDRLGGRAVLERMPSNPRLREVRVDQGYRSEPFAQWCTEKLQAVLSVTERDPNRKGFVVQKGRWVVERTFAWLGRYRRLSKDYEGCVTCSEAMLYLASIRLFLHRFTR